MRQVITMPPFKTWRNRVLACLFLTLGYAAVKVVPEDRRQGQALSQHHKQLMPTNPTSKEGDIFYATVEGITYRLTAGAATYHQGENDLMLGGGNDCRKVDITRLGETHWYSDKTINRESYSCADTTGQK